MSMSKREFMEQAWIPIHKRLPQGEFHDSIFCYNSRTGLFTELPATLAREYAEEILGGKLKDTNPSVEPDDDTYALEFTAQDLTQISWDSYFTHWMRPFPPPGGLTYPEYLDKEKAKEKQQKKRGRKK